MMHREVDEIAHTQAPLAQFDPPPHQPFNEHGSAAQAAQNRALGRLDALGKRDLVVPGKQLCIPHLTEIGVNQVARKPGLRAGVCLADGILQVGRSDSRRLWLLAEHLNQHVLPGGGRTFTLLSKMTIHFKSHRTKFISMRRLRPA